MGHERQQKGERGAEKDLTHLKCLSVAFKPSSCLYKQLEHWYCMSHCSVWVHDPCHRTLLWTLQTPLHYLHLWRSLCMSLPAPGLLRPGDRAGMCSTMKTEEDLFCYHIIIMFMYNRKWGRQGEKKSKRQSSKGKERYEFGVSVEGKTRNHSHSPTSSQPLVQ